MDPVILMPMMKLFFCIIFLVSKPPEISIFEKNSYSWSHYCPVKVDKAFFEIIEIQSTTALFKGATI